MVEFTVAVDTLLLLLLLDSMVMMDTVVRFLSPGPSIYGDGYGRVFDLIYFNGVDFIVHGWFDNNRYVCSGYICVAIIIVVCCCQIRLHCATK